MSDLIADIIYAELDDRKGFDHLLSEIDDEVKAELFGTLAKQIRQQVGRELHERVDKTGYSVNIIDVNEICQMKVQE